ncbi:MAG TPA: hypothetical protein GXZ36_04185 [Firmicutes bacterium]|nr:hypothetical protein [Bacillota bacterium]
MKRRSGLMPCPIARLLFLLLLSFSLLLLCSSLSLGKVEPIIPYLSDQAVLGLAVEGAEQKITPYLWAGYDLDYQEGAYKIGGRIRLNPNHTEKPTQTWLDLNYGYWPSHEAAGYPFHRGWAGSLHWKDRATSFKATIFTGELSPGHFRGSTVDAFYQEAVKVTHLHLHYNRLLYQDWKKTVYFLMAITSGQPRGSDQTFSATTWTLPIQSGSFRWKTQAGYITRCEQVVPYFDLADLVRGYGKIVKTGDRIFGITMEKLFQPFPFSDLPLVNLLHITAFTDAGGLLRSGEAPRDLKFHHSAGVGLLLDLGQSDLRLEGVVTDEGRHQILFYLDTFFPGQAEY